MCAFAHRVLSETGIAFSFPLRGVCVVFRRRKAEQTFLYLTDSPYPVKLVSVREPILQYLRDVFCVERRCARARVFDNEHERDLRIFGRGEADKKRRCFFAVNFCRTGFYGDGRKRIIRKAGAC